MSLGPERLRAYEGALTSVADTVLITDASCRVVFSNAATEALTGWSPGDALGRSVYEVLRGAGASNALTPQQVVRMALAGRRRQDFSDHTEISHRDGSRRSVSGCVVPIVGDCRGLCGAVVVARDRTRECDLLDALGTSAQGFLTLFHASPIGAALLSLDAARLEDVNESLSGMLGRTREELLGRSAFEAGFWCDPAQGKALLDALARQGRLPATEVRLRAMAGDDRLVLLSAETLEMEGQRHGLCMMVDITERKLAEESLRETAERYRLLFDNTEEGVLLAGPDGRIVQANPAARRMLGRSGDALSSWEWADVFDPMDPRLALAREERARTGHVRTKLTMVRKDGSKFVAEVASTMFRDRNLEVHRSVFIRDVTERERTEAALRASEEQFRLLFHTAPFGAALFHLVHGPSGQIVDWEFQDINAVGAATIRWSREQVIGSRVTALLGPESVKVLLDRCSDVVSSGRTRQFEVTPERTDRILLCTLFRLGSELYGLMTADITDRKRLDAERERLVGAVAQSDEVVVVTDTAGTIQYVNKAFTEVTGYTRAESIGRNAGFIKAGEAEPDFYHALWDTISRGEVWRGQFTNLKKDGTRYVEQATISPVHDASGSITNYLGVKRDITRELNLESQLRQSQRMESVGRLAGGVAHDFNNMLSVVLGRTDMALTHAELPHEVREDLTEVRAAALRASDITRQLLAFARKQPVAPRVLDLNDSVGFTLKMIRRLIGEHIEVVWRPDPEAWKVFLDPTQLDQVLVNLALNARDAIDASGTLTIGTSNVELDAETCLVDGVPHGGNYVVLSVTDSGRGMDPSIVDRIFEPFFTTKEPGQGTGLGLAIVYGIVKQAGGFINVHSEPHKGSAFRIFIPRFEGHVAKESDPSAESLTFAGGGTVLLVEDEQMILQFARAALEQLGYTVFSADSPTQALVLARQHATAIQLLLTDVVMPEMSGRQLALQVASFIPNLKVLYMSGHAIDVVNHGIVADGCPFLQKPFSISDLSRKMRDALDRTPFHD